MHDAPRASKVRAVSDPRMSDDANTSDEPARSDWLRQGTLLLPGIGEIALVWSERGLLMLSLPSRSREELAADMVDRGIEAPPFAEVPDPYRRVLLAYAAGEEVDPVQLPVDLQGTPFQLRVWNALRRIPRG